MYPFYERLVKWSKDHPGVVNVCIHKGLFPPSVEQQFPHLVGYCHVGDVGKAAKDWPQLNFIIYHSAYRWAGGGTAEQALEQLNRTGRIEWVNDLAEIPAQFGVKNVYGDLGQIFAQSTMADPRICAFMMGTLVKGLGSDHVVWGSDAVWTGSPQWQIEALRRLEIPEEMQKKHGFKPLGPADGPVKRAIFGENNARLYHFNPQQRSALENDRFAQLKDDYERNGAARSNLTYGYIYKPTASEYFRLWRHRRSAVPLLCDEKQYSMPNEIKILSAGAVKPGLTKVIDAFQRDNGNRVQVSFATAPAILKQIDEGATVDVVIAPPGVLEQLVKSENTRRARR